MRFINITGLYTGKIGYMADEAGRIKKETGLDEVALSLTLHPEGFPAIRKPEFFTEVFRQYKQALEGSGVKTGILLQSLIGHGWPGAPVSPEKWQHSVNIHGHTTLRMCPLDPGFREYVRRTVTMLAKEKPYSFLVDDDVRLINGQGLECFCPHHLARFNALSEREYTADELREIVKNAKPGDSLLERFEKVRRESLFEFADLIRAAIDAVDPSIRCGYCTPGWENLISGEMAKRLAGKTKPFLRVNNAMYLEGDAKFFASQMNYTQMLRKYNPDIPELLDESDTFPQHRYSKSALSMHAHITGAILNGLNGAKLWLTNLSWPDPATERNYDRILGKYRNFYQELERTMRTVRLQGPIVPLVSGENVWHPLNPNGLFFETNWNACTLGHFGIPARWEPLSVSGLRTLSGADSIAFFTDGELKQLLSGPLLLDGTAAKAMAERGFAEELGVTPESKEYRFSFEEDRQTGERMSFMNDFICPYLSVNSEKTEVLTDLKKAAFRGSPDTAVIAPGVTYFENGLGGKIAVYAVHLKMSSINYQSPGRRRLLLKVLDKLNGEPLPYVVMELQNIYTLHGIAEDGSDLLPVFNLNFDPLETIPIRVRKNIAEVRELSPEGTWETLEWKRNGDILEVSKKLIDYESAILKIRTE